MMDGAPDPIRSKHIAKVYRCFAASGRLQRWPSKRAEQQLVLWAIWVGMPNDTEISEAEISALLRARHDYEDFALIRRELIELGLFRRTPDGRVYRRVEHEVPEDVALLVAQFSAA